MTIFTGSARREIAAIVGLSLLAAIIVNAGPIVAIVLNWMG